ncbi:MAG: membrane protein insertase YidC [Candidatus Staskawiczbacteria bacterium]|nr:membrane protein insertase YidC [Candidatus Staskawiczbacteria bacterium]
MFGFLVNIFNIALYLPLFNLLILIYNYLPLSDFGLAIIILTIIIRLILYPISVKALHSQRALQKIQPKVQELQKKYKDDKEKQARETLELYKTEKVNPFSGLLLAIIQLPILIALYRVFWQGLKPEELVNLYGFIANPGNINTMFLGLIDLSQPNIVFAILAGLTQFVQTKMLLPRQGNSKEKDVSQMVQKQMIYFLPVITVVILFRLPSALGLYWTISSIFSIVQQYFLTRKDLINKKNG